MNYDYFKINVKKVTIAFTILISISTGFASEKIVSCLIKSKGALPFKGKCLFLKEEGSSFSLHNADKSKPILEGISDIHVYIVEKDVADVRGLTLDGINSRWGEAKRSSKDKACWVGSDFQICAWERVTQ